MADPNVTVSDIVCLHHMQYPSPTNKDGEGRKRAEQGNSDVDVGSSLQQKSRNNQAHSLKLTTVTLYQQKI